MIFHVWFGRWRREPEHVESDDDGTVTFNWLQQRERDDSERPLTAVEEYETTDPWGVTG